MTSRFDKTLEELLKGDTEKAVEGLPDNESVEEDYTPSTEVSPVVYDEVESNYPVEQQGNKDLATDYQAARSNLYGLLGRTNAAIEMALKLALATESPRAIETVANLIKVSGDMSKDLVGLHKAVQKELNQQQPSSGDTYNIQNNHHHYSETTKGIDDALDSLDDDESYKE